MNDATPEYEILLKLVEKDTEEEFKGELDDLGIPFAVGHIYVFKDRKYRGFLFFKKIWDQVKNRFTVEIYGHPTINSIKYTANDIYNRFFGKEVEELWDLINRRSSLVKKNKREIDKRITILKRKIDYIKTFIHFFLEIDCEYPPIQLKKVIKKFEEFLRLEGYE